MSNFTNIGNYKYIWKSKVGTDANIPIREPLLRTRKYELPVMFPFVKVLVTRELLSISIEGTVQHASA